MKGRAIAERIYSEEPDAEVLLSSYKDVIGSLERAVYMRLRSSGAVDANRGELQTITYGMETATNEYRDCQYIIEVGTFQAPDYAIDNLIAGQLGDEKYAPEKLEELRDIVALTEMVHTFYQRTFRVQLRLNDPSRTISLYGFSKYREEIREVLEPRMPEFQWDFEDSPDPFAHAKVKRKELSSSESSLKKVERRFLYDYANLLVRNGPLTQKDIAESLAIPADTVKSNFQQWSRRKDREPYSLISKDDSSRPVRYFVNCEERLRSLQKRYEPDSLLGEKDSLTASG